MGGGDGGGRRWGTGEYKPICDAVERGEERKETEGAWQERDRRCYAEKAGNVRCGVTFGRVKES